MVIEDVFSRALAGPDAVLRNGMRMPPGQVVSHSYLIDDPPPGKSWFDDWFPPSRDEEFVRARANRFLRRIENGQPLYILRTAADGVLALPAHAEDVPVWLVFESEAAARDFTVEADFDSSPEEVSPEELREELLPSLAETDGLLGPSWTADLVGAELDPAELLRALPPLRAGGTSG